MIREQSLLRSPLRILEQRLTGLLDIEDGWQGLEEWVATVTREVDVAIGRPLDTTPDSQRGLQV
jgi:hypothetical protein